MDSALVNRKSNIVNGSALLSFSEVVARLGMSENTVRKLIAARVLTPFRPVKHMYPKYYESEVEALLKAPEKNSKPK